MRNDFKISNREYRILAVAIIFFLVGIFFFYKDDYGSRNEIKIPAPAQNFQVADESPTLDPLFAKFPAPSKFEKFTYDGQMINNNDLLVATTTCQALFVTILIFPAIFDYRQDATKAVFNQAFECSAGKDFTYNISKNSLNNVPKGDYYVIIADQGKTGMWYNPR